MVTSKQWREFATPAGLLRRHYRYPHNLDSLVHAWFRFEAVGPDGDLIYVKANGPNDAPSG
jgi:hypothetical protein